MTICIFHFKPTVPAGGACLPCNKPGSPKARSAELYDHHKILLYFLGVLAYYIYVHSGKATVPGMPHSLQGQGKCSNPLDFYRRGDIRLVIFLKAGASRHHGRNSLVSTSPHQIIQHEICIGIVGSYSIHNNFGDRFILALI